MYFCWEAKHFFVIIYHEKKTLLKHDQVKGKYGSINRDVSPYKSK